MGQSAHFHEQSLPLGMGLGTTIQADTEPKVMLLVKTCKQLQKYLFARS